MIAILTLSLSIVKVSYVFYTSFIVIVIVIINLMCKHFSFLHNVNRNRSSQLGPRLSRPLHLPAHSGPMVQMTITHQGAAAHLVEEEGEVASTPLVDWYSDRKNNAAEKPYELALREPWTAT